MRNEIYEEYLEEMREDARVEELREAKMRSDFDYFLKHYEKDIEEISNLYTYLKDEFEHYGYDFDIKDILI